MEQVLKIRTLNRDDLKEIKIIHDKFYKNEFQLPEDHYLASFVIEGNEGIVTAGGIRTIPELIAITNKDMSVRSRREALIKLLQASSFVCDNLNYSHIHAFVQDENWYHQLIRHGFHIPKGKALIYG